MSERKIYMTVYDKYGDNWENIILEDDNNTSFGGVAFQGETLYDFCEADFDPTTTTIEEINVILKKCGIKPI